MELIRGLNAVAARHHGAAVTVGSFDGIHLGHKALIDRARAIAADLGRPSVVLTFEPLPREYLAPPPVPSRLTDFRERWRVLEQAGVDLLCLLRFDARLRNLTGEQFIALLAQHLRAAVVVVGHDFKFARGGAATAAFLQQRALASGIVVEVVAPVCVNGVRVSSTAVRAALERGDFAAARMLLGRDYSMRGRVVPGQRLGRKLGYPTANLRMRRRVIPHTGIFAVRVRGVVAGRACDGVASLGTRPTVGGIEPLLEAHVFDFDGDLYGRELEVEFVGKIREELKFESLDALIEQMHLDARAARHLLAA
jgi:riboflavin kinase/FMN adenylyltransferase